MTTIFDILTMAIFSGLIVLFLQRSIGEGPFKDALWQYLAAAVGCAVANYLGNNDHPLVAVLAIVLTLMFIVYVLRPFARSHQP